jgi:hypothetical protein
MSSRSTALLPLLHIARLLRRHLDHTDPLVELGLLDPTTVPLDSATPELPARTAPEDTTEWPFGAAAIDRGPGARR